MLNGHRIGAVLLLGGTGKRFGSEIPKQFHRLSGKPIYRVTLDVLLKSRFIDDIILSCHSDWIEKVRQDLQGYPNIQCVVGGASRQESSFRGLLGFKIPPAVVLIHDAVRPFVSVEILQKNAELALQYGAVNTCIASADTLVHSKTQATIASIPDRSQYLRGQTPQSFSYALILEAHQKSKCKDASDDCRLVLDLGHPVWIAQGSEANLKITSELDLFIAEQLFRLNTSSSFGPPLSIAGKRYAVVGGSGGIGSAVCEALQMAGATAIALSRTTPLALDLQDSSSINTAFEQLGGLDGLINCAGLLMVKTLKNLTLLEIQSLLNINLLGLIICCQKAKVKKGGHIVNVASSSFTRGRKEMTIYSCAKAAVVNFTQGLSEERPDLRVHAVIPQRTRTKMRLDHFLEEDVNCLLEPKEVATQIVQLLRDPNSTGLLIEVKKM
jgi:2-C-methyl-D-erythritol 4-phosphate cytidylyltransferase